MKKRSIIIFCIILMFVFGFFFCACQDPQTIIQNIETRCIEAQLYMSAVSADEIGLNVNEGYRDAYIATDGNNINILVIKFSNSGFAKKNMEYFSGSEDSYFGLENVRLIGQWIVCYSNAAKDIVKL